MATEPARRSGRFRGILVDVEPLRRDRDYRLLWAGQLISGVGRQVTVVALPFQLYVLTGSTLAVGLLAVVQLIPILVFALGRRAPWPTRWTGVGSCSPRSSPWPARARPSSPWR